MGSSIIGSVKKSAVLEEHVPRPDLWNSLEQGDAFYIDEQGEDSPYVQFEVADLCTVGMKFHLGAGSAAVHPSACSEVLERLRGRAPVGVVTGQALDVRFSVAREDQNTEQAVTTLAAWVVARYGLVPGCQYVTVRRNTV